MSWVLDEGLKSASCQRPAWGVREQAERGGRRISAMLVRLEDVPAARFKLDGELTTAASLVIEQGRMTQIHRVHTHGW